MCEMTSVNSGSSITYTFEINTFLLQLDGRQLNQTIRQSYFLKTMEKQVRDFKLIMHSVYISVLSDAQKISSCHAINNTRKYL